MSFQKAHNFSNELGEIVLTSDEIDLNSVATTSLPVQPLYKNYRILEVGFVVTENLAATSDLEIRFGTVGNPDGIVNETTAKVPIPENSFGTTFSTNTGAFSFEVPSEPGVKLTLVDQDGIPRISAGERIIFRVGVAAGTSTTAHVFARLAPTTAYKD
tara:strand:+ start:884 stop:1357 length:474 start_codon:yes stop_codon:yes gene_type:complete